MTQPPFADKTLLGTCIQLAHSTFFETLPANVQHRGAVAPHDLSPKRAPRPNLRQRALAALRAWSHRRRVASREAYLAHAQNAAELEARLREIQRRPYY